MHYSPSDKDGVFVVEVARGADTSYHSPRAAIAAAQQQQQFNGVDLLNTSSASPDAATNDQQQQQRVQVHHHPPPSATAEAAPVMTTKALNGELKSNTGLSQSDLSDSSSAGSNKDYSYGNQGGAYATGEPGGRQTIQVALQSQQPKQHRPVAKQETIDLEPRLQSDIDLLKVETERRDHCNGHVQQPPQESNGGVLPDILVKSSEVTATPVSIVGQSVVES